MTEELRKQLALRAGSSVDANRIVTGDEVAEWPGGTLQALIIEGLLEEIQPSNSAECRECFEGHVEVVDFIEEPPGSELRAYISCPEAGRVAVDTERLRRWQIAPKAAEESPPTDKAEEAGRQTKGDHIEVFAPETSWPPTAAAFVSILRQAQSAHAPLLPWNQLRDRLRALGYYPSRARDVKRKVPNWDQIVDSPRRGFYRLRS